MFVGMMEITKAIDELHKKPFFQSPAVRIHPLHSSLSTSEQTTVFEVPEAGVRKIVVATNVSPQL
jgi:ATP-dependent RNA helicase DHX29